MSWNFLSILSRYVAEHFLATSTSLGDVTLPPTFHRDSRSRLYNLSFRHDECFVMISCPSCLARDSDVQLPGLLQAEC